MSQDIADRRYVGGPGYDKDGFIVPVEKGGTNATTAQEARDNLNAVSSASRNLPLGTLGLNASGQAEITTFSDGSTIQGRNSVSGPKVVGASSTNQYTITDYDSPTGYTLETINGGTVSRSGATITYNSPAGLGFFGFKLNGRTYSIENALPKPSKPVITAPVNGSTGVSEFFVMTSSAFSMNFGNDTHESTDWQIANNSQFSPLLDSVTASTTAKTSWAPTGMTEQTLLYVRCRHKGVASGYGEWSNENSFTTAAVFFPSAEVQILSHYSSGNNISFGVSIDIDSTGQYLVVGSETDTVNFGIGSAQIFKRNPSNGSYSELTNLFPNWSADTQYGGTNFGRQVAISRDGTWVAVAEAGNTNNGNMQSKGSVAVYQRSGGSWSFIQKLQIDGTDILSTGYGLSFTPDSNMLFFSYYRGTNTSNTPYMAVCTRSGQLWTIPNSFQPSVIDNGFGKNILFSSDGLRMFVSTTAANQGQGCVYVYKRNTVNETNWSQEARVVCPESTLRYFSYRLAVNSDGSKFVASAPYLTVGSDTEVGVCYVYKRTGTAWSLEQTINNPAPVQADFFGCGVCMSADGTMIAVLNNAGNKKIRVFRYSGSTWSLVKEFQAATTIADNTPGQMKLSDDLSTLLTSFKNHIVSPGTYGAGFVFK